MLGGGPFNLRAKLAKRMVIEKFATALHDGPA